MGFIERIFCKADHLVVDLIGCSFGNSVANTTLDFYSSIFVIFSVDEVFTFLFHNVALLLTHGTTNQVTSAIGVAGQISYDLHNLFLIHHTTVSHGKDRSQTLIDIVRVLGIFLIFNIGGDGTHGTRSIQGNSRNHIFEAVRLQISHELSHSTAFQLEHAHGISATNQLIHLGIVIVHIGKVHATSMIFFNEINGITNDSQVSQTQEVHL